MYSEVDQKNPLYFGNNLELNLQLTHLRRLGIFYKYAVNQKIIVLLLRWSSTGGRAGGDLARPRDLGPGYGSLSRPGLGGARERPSLASLGAAASWAPGARHHQEPAR